MRVEGDQLLPESDPGDAVVGQQLLLVGAGHGPEEAVETLGAFLPRVDQAEEKVGQGVILGGSGNQGPAQAVAGEYSLDLGQFEEEIEIPAAVIGLEEPVDEDGKGQLPAPFAPETVELLNVLVVSVSVQHLLHEGGPLAIVALVANHRRRRGGSGRRLGLSLLWFRQGPDQGFRRFALDINIFDLQLQGGTRREPRPAVFDDQFHGTLDRGVVNEESSGQKRRRRQPPPARRTTGASDASAAEDDIFGTQKYPLAKVRNDSPRNLPGRAEKSRFLID